MLRQTLVFAVSFVLACSVAMAQQGPSSITVIQPCRLFDSRDLPGGQRLQHGTTYQIKARGSCGIPTEANAIFLTVVATGATAEGYLTVWPSDLLAPSASTMNYRGNGTDSSATWSRLCAPPLNECSEVDLSFRPSAASTHVILDVVGWTVPLPDE